MGSSYTFVDKKSSCFVKFCRYYFFVVKTGDTRVSPIAGSQTSVSDVQIVSSRFQPQKKLRKKRSSFRNWRALDDYSAL